MCFSGSTQIEALRDNDVPSRDHGLEVLYRYFPGFPLNPYGSADASPNL